MSADPHAEPSARTWWAAWVAAWLLLVAIASLEVVLTAAAFDNPHFSVRAFLAGRSVELAGQFAVAAASLALVRRLAPAARVGAGRHLLLALLAVAPAPALGSLLGHQLDRLVRAGGVVFRGSLLARHLADYVPLAGATTAAAALELARRLRARERHAAELEARLAEARLDALAAQLHPHFLFNTLNAVAVLVHRAPEEADAMLTRLAELLRAALREDRAHEIPLAEEVALLARYVDIMRIRFGPRLTVETRVAPDAGGVGVPAFVLQPLVENALEHGVARRAGPGRVTVSAEVLDGTLRLAVTDDGPGLAPDVGREGGGRGVGLANTRRRLEALYGEGGRLSLERLPGEGTRAVVELPARPAPNGDGGRA